MAEVSGGTRWVQLGLGVAAMVVISSPQYTWTLFVPSLRGVTGASVAAVQVTFSLLIVLQTWFSPIQAFLVDRFGPRLLLSLGAILVGASWLLAAPVGSLLGLYLTYGLLGGIGTGIVYVGVVGLMVGWFPDRRGLAVGLVAAGYGAGAFLTTIPIAAMVHAGDYRQALVGFGIAQGLVGLAVAQGLRRPPKELGFDTAAVADGRQSRRSYSARQMLRTRPYWLLLVMMAMMSTGGLMVAAQVELFAKDFGVDNYQVLGVGAVALSLSLSRITNGLTRPFFGWVSDRIGREHTMLIAFSLEGLAVLSVLAFRNDPVLFVLLTGVVFFGWGEIFSLFPATLTDIYGPEHATTNYGFLYVAQGVGAVLGGPAAAYLVSVTGSWSPVFFIVAALDLTAALLAYFVLRPMRRRWVGDQPAAVQAVPQ
ncbi:oxalate/formate MFS antiporter [Pseudonocardia acaciae]|uniref:oxalate/formate MFS antiporter n=1 Tax=Pseudonocardia acaciae TaxID=551276 RepID=UPI00048F829D|nr:oxalate/formate MFS antiporter [Pseudonocardia acaciae]